MGKLRINRDLRNDTLIIECDYTKYVIIQHAITRRITAFRNTHRAGVEVENLPPLFCHWQMGMTVHQHIVLV